MINDEIKYLNESNALTSIINSYDNDMFRQYIEENQNLNAEYQTFSSRDKKLKIVLFVVVTFLIIVIIIIIVAFFIWKKKKVNIY